MLSVLKDNCSGFENSAVRCVCSSPLYAEEVFVCQEVRMM